MCVNVCPFLTWCVCACACMCVCPLSVVLGYMRRQGALLCTREDRYCRNIKRGRERESERDASLYELWNEAPVICLLKF